MGQEIERKFLLVNDGWRLLAEGELFQQGYICADSQKTVRIRLAGKKGFLTIKGATKGISRAEFEYEIPFGDATRLLATLCAQPCIEKTRYRVFHEGFTWEIDEFLGANKGLIVAEIELESEDEFFTKPEWLGAEVSGDPRYTNAMLCRFPYSAWEKTP